MLYTKINSHAKVLIVEDIHINRHIFTEMLSLLGLKSIAVSSGSQALEHLRQKSFNLILMDIQMPDMEGYEVSQCIRNGEVGTRNQNTPIIAITANTYHDEYEKCILNGINDFMKKPVEFQKFEETVSKWLAHGSYSLCHSRIQSLLSIKNNKLIVQLYEFFKSEIPPKINELKYFAENGNLKAASQVAHAIKSSSGTIGAQRLYDVCNYIEKMKSINPGTLPALLKVVEQEYQLANVEFQERLPYE